MKQLEKVQNNTTWAKASNTINNNNDALYVAVTTLEHAAFKHKGYFKSVALLYGAYPTAENGAQAFVYNSTNPTSSPYDIYEWVNDAWQDTGTNGGNVNVNLDSKQDALVGYSESVSDGKATQVAIQGDAIALSGKVSLGGVDNIESAILTSSSQASAAITKANTLEQSISALKSPVKPIHLNSQGNLELNVGKGLYIEEGKLCATGTPSSSGGGGGTTYSEGQGISIYNDKISVAYNVETLTIDNCGGLTVNYDPDTLKIKNGMLSAQTSVNAGNGLVKKGDALQVSVGTGLLVEDDVYVNIGKGLATDNLNRVNLNLDEQTLTTDYCGKVIVNKDNLIGNGLKKEYNKLAVNYGEGLALKNKAIVVNYGRGLNIECGKLVSTASGGGTTYTAGDGISISDNNQISFKQGTALESVDGAIQVAISSGLEYDRANANKIRVKAGGGIEIPYTGEVKVKVGTGLGIGGDGKLYSTINSGTTYTAGEGINIENNQISVSNSVKSALTTLRESVKGKQDALTLATGLEWGDTDMIQVKMNAPLSHDEGGRLMLNYGTGLAVDSDGNLYSTVSGGTTYTAGDGISISGNKIAVLYGSGLTTSNNKLAVNYGTALGISNSQIYVKYSTSYLTTDSAGFLTIDVNNLKKALGIL